MACGAAIADPRWVVSLVALAALTSSLAAYGLLQLYYKLRSIDEYAAWYALSWASVTAATLGLGYPIAVAHTYANLAVDEARLVVIGKALLLGAAPYVAPLVIARAAARRSRVASRSTRL